tara:strand:+ start:3353 stop:4687 length:1335 start_codon:yes stop_codon:yes gene_type:complete
MAEQETSLRGGTTRQSASLEHTTDRLPHSVRNDEHETSLRGTKQSAQSKTLPLMPKLRFKEFDGEWTRKDFGSIVEKVKDKYDPKKSNIEYPCIEMESISKENSILLEVFNSRGQLSIKNKFSKGDVLFGKLRPNLKKYIIAPFEGVCSSEIWVLKGKKLSNEFLFRLIQTNKFYVSTLVTSGSKMPRADWAYISSSIFPFPTLPEQKKIASFLSAVDEKIQQLTKKKALLEQYKKGVMQQLFSGELRFKDENGEDFPDWEEKRLGSLTYKVGKKNKENIQYPIYSINNQEGFRPQSEQFDGLDSNDRGYDISLYKIVESKTFAYNPARINVGSIGYSYDLTKVIVSSLYVCFKTKDALEDLYLLAYLDTYNFQKDILRYEEGGVRQYLFFDNFCHIKIPLPTIREQQKIANYLSAIDTKIETVNQQIEKTQSFKKGLLQQMFV